MAILNKDKEVIQAKVVFQEDRGAKEAIQAKVADIRDNNHRYNFY